MKKKCMRIVAFLLSISMSLNLVQVGAFATENELSDYSAEFAIETDESDVVDEVDGIDSTTTDHFDSSANFLKNEKEAEDDADSTNTDNFSFSEDTLKSELESTSEDIINDINDYNSVATYSVDGTEKNSEGAIRYTVLILDTSGSMSGTPSAVQKQAATKFCKAITDADGTNYVSIVKLNSTSSVGCGFTTEYATLSNYISTIPASGGTNINQALTVSGDLLASVTEENAIKNIVLCSDGLPESGSTASSGKYSSSNHSSYYTYGNVCYTTAESLKNSGYYIYTLGFFHDLSGKDLAFGHQLMEDLASTSSMYYEVTNADELEFTFGEIADDVISDTTKSTGKFNYASGNEKDYQATYFYDDAYFTKDATTYQDSLATMSMCLALSGFGSNETNDYSKKSQNLKQLLNNCGFSEEHFDTNDGYKNKPSTDTIGVGASYKTITVDDKAYTLIAAVVRGGGYEAEWASNFTVGASGTHKGFSEARDQVLNFLSKYIEEKEIKGDVKLWITGYSRAAATTNLVAGKLVDGFSLSNDIALSSKNVYAYCFEAPKGGLLSDNITSDTNDKYNNIFSIVNPSDLVTKVAPTQPIKEFGFARYGVTKFLPSAINDSDFGGNDVKYTKKLEEMKKFYNSLESVDEYIVDNFQMKKISVANLVWDIPGFLKDGIVVNDDDEKWDQNAFLDTTITKLFEQIRDRYNYVDKYQADIREICKVVFGTDSGQWGVFQDKFIDNLKSDIGYIACFIVLNKESKLIPLIEDDMTKALNDAGITNYDSKDVNSAAAKIAALLLKFGVSHPNLTITAVSNFKGIAAAHFPELCLSWLMSFDKNYTDEGKAGFTSGMYRTIHINCPVDVKVYSNDDTLVAEIIADNVHDINSSIVAYINEEGEKLVYLPSDAEFKVQISATDNGTMTYSVDEHSELYGGTSRIVNYFDLELQEGDSFTSVIPQIDDKDVSIGSSTVEYNLYDANGKAIDSDNDISGEKAYQSVCSVNAISNNEEYGLVLGSDVVQYGNYVKLTAIPAEGCSFAGWYCNGNLLSTEKEFRICVKENLDIVGNFTSKHSHSYQVPSFNWTKTNSCTATFECKSCDAVQNLSCKIVSTTKPATCTEKGNTTYTASVEFNGTVYTDTKKVKIKKLGHKWSDWKVVCEPTCTRAGSYKRVCSHDSSHVKYAFIPAIGHMYGEWTVTKKPSCTEYGEVKSVCINDANHVETRIIEAFGHNYKTVITKAKPKKNGKKVVKCNICGSIKRKTTIRAPKKIILSKKSFSYNGKAHKPAVTVKDAKNKTIPASNYKVTYSKGCKKAGKYTVKVTFVGSKYSGSMKTTFRIKK